MLIEGNAGSIGELVLEASRITGSFKPDFNFREEIWFRGQRECNFNLQPYLYRSSVAAYHYNESALFDRFVAFATPLVPRVPASDWEWYFLARHHGLPSRLLDWSESILAAAYFAICDHLPGDRLELDAKLQGVPEPPRFDDACPVVWVLDAGSLNLVSIGHDALVVPGFPISAPYLPDALHQEKSSRNAKPIAILPPRTDSRIVAQQGMFTLHGHETVPLDVVAQSSDDIKLGRIRLDTSRSAKFSADLRVMGVHRLSVFPDLDSVAAQVCWHYQSTV